MLNKALLLLGKQEEHLGDGEYRMVVGAYESGTLLSYGFSASSEVGSLEPTVFEGANILAFWLDSVSVTRAIDKPTLNTPSCYISFDSTLPSGDIKVTVDGQEYLFSFDSFDRYVGSGIPAQEGDELIIKLELVNE